jgi:hypothetical protein
MLRVVSTVKWLKPNSKSMRLRLTDRHSSKALPIVSSKRLLATLRLRRLSFVFKDVMKESRPVGSSPSVVRELFSKSKN